MLPEYRETSCPSSIWFKTHGFSVVEANETHETRSVTSEAKLNYDVYPESWPLLTGQWCQRESSIEYKTIGVRLGRTYPWWCRMYQTPDVFCSCELPPPTSLPVSSCIVINNPSREKHRSNQDKSLKFGALFWCVFPKATSPNALRGFSIWGKMFHHSIAPGSRSSTS